MSTTTSYSLSLSAEEVARYQFMAQRAATEEAAAWLRAGIVAGAHVADVGCGPGAPLLAMAAAVGPTGSVYGVDWDADAIAIAQQLIAADGCTNASVDVGLADDSGLAYGSVDVAVARHVLAHNGGREDQIVRHLADLAKPGGSVYIVDVDLTAIRVLSHEPDAQDLLDRYADYQQQRGNDPRVGLRLGALLTAAGLQDVEHSGSWTILAAPPGMRPAAWAAREAMVAEGAATEDDVVRWGEALSRMDSAENRPTMFLPLFIAMGRRR